MTDLPIRSRSLRLAGLAAASLCALLTGCPGENAATPEEKRCTLDADCDSGLYCSATGVCQSDCGMTGQACDPDKVCSDRGRCVEAASACQTADECDAPPGGAKRCEGGTSISPRSIGRCVVPTPGEARECRYDDVREPCQESCNEDTGECDAVAPDPCDGVSCEAPPESRCEDASTLTRYAAAGSCAEGACTYQPEEVDCPTGCADGACNAGVCEEDSCDGAQMPEDACSETDPDVAISYQDQASCFDTDGAPQCEFLASFEQCRYNGASCQAGACAGALAQSGEVIVSEYFTEPAGESALKFSRQWIELYNTTDADIELSNWTIETDTKSHLIAPGTDGSGSLLIPARSYIVLANGSDPFGDGAEPDYRYGDVLLGFEGALSVKKQDGGVSDYLFWERGSTTRGASRQIAAGEELTAESNDRPEVWCPNLISDLPAAGAFGTPGATNVMCALDPCASFSCEQVPEARCKDTATRLAPMNSTPQCQISFFRSPYCDFQIAEQACEAATPYCLQGSCLALPDNLPTMAGELIITEIMGDPEGADGEREWLELYNTTDRELALFTLKIEDNEQGNKFTSMQILDPQATIPANGYVVLAANPDAALNGNIQGALALGSGLLKNTPDEDPGSGESLMRLKLVTESGTLIDEVYYAKPKSGQAQQLSLSSYSGAGVTDPGASNDTPANFCLATAEYASGYGTGSPGAANEECP